MHSKLTLRISLFLFGAIAITVVTVGVALFWMAREHDRFSANDSEIMIRGGLSALQETLKRVTVDYSWWETALNAIEAEDGEWIYDNIGTGVTESATTDLVVVVPSLGEPRYGWIKGGGEDSDPRILTSEQVAMMRDSLRDVPKDEVVARTRFATVGGEVYLLAAAYVTPDDLEGVDFATLPFQILGFHLEEERIGELGGTFLTDDLAIVSVVPENKKAIAINLDDGSGQFHLAWTAPAPGAELLKKTLLPVSSALGFFALLGVAAASAARNSAIELSKKEAEAFRDARTDVLTGLPNRLCFLEKTSESAIRRACAAGNLAVIFIDLDGFKKVNDTIGHAGGDELIFQVARRLDGALPRDVFLARVGGDEFNILVTGRKAALLAENAARACMETLVSDFQVAGKRFNVTASVGFACSAGEEINCDELVRRADVAMYEAKNTRAGEPICYRPEHESDAVRNRQVEDALRNALNEGQIDVLYQPIIDAVSGELKAAEALARWNWRGFGMVSPGTFIPVAEESGLISRLGTHVFRKACEDLAKWPGLNISINLSPVQLRDPLLVEHLLGIVGETGVDPGHIELELTEGIVVSHPQLAKIKLEKLKNAGFRVALDDFGTGFSSIGYLRQLPFDKLKIDQSFVIGLGGSDSGMEELLQSIAGLGRALDLIVVAEGIETEEQAVICKLAGCQQLQGFYFGKPLTFAQLRRWQGQRRKTHALREAG